MVQALHQSGPLGWVTLLVALAAVAVAVAHAVTPRRWTFITTLGLGFGAISIGLLGTVVGLIQAFGAVAAVEPSMKASLLAQAIGAAMHCTAFGLGALPLWLAGLIAGALRRRRTVTVALPQNASPPPDDGSITR